MNGKKLFSPLIAALFLLLGTMKMAYGAEPTFIITLSNTPQEVTVPIGLSTTVYFKIVNNTPQTFPSFFVKSSSLLNGVQLIQDMNTTCNFGAPFPGGANCVFGLQITGLENSIPFTLVPIVCEAKGVYCSEPDTNNRIEVEFIVGPQLLITGPTLAALIPGGETVLQVTNNSMQTVNGITLDTALLPADYQSQITVDDSFCAGGLAPSNFCTINIQTHANAAASAEHAMATISGDDTNVIDINLWMGAIFINKNTSEHLGAQSINISESSNYMNAGGNALIDEPSFGSDLDTVNWCSPSFGCSDFVSDCDVGSTLATNCTLWFEAQENEDLGEITGPNSYIQINLEENAQPVFYDYQQAADYTYFLYQGGDNGISVWDGSSLTATLMPLTAGQTVNALSIWQSDLYAGGQFSLFGGAIANNIAGWDGTAWTPLDTGTNGIVYALAPTTTFDSSGVLYAGGSFSTAGSGGSNTALNIASWNGSSWSPLDDGSPELGVDGAVYSLFYRAGIQILYVGGAFTNAGVTLVNNITGWNGADWSAFVATGDNPITETGTSGTGDVFSITNYLEGNIYLGGSFSRLGADAAAIHIGGWSDELTFNTPHWDALRGGVGTPPSNPPEGEVYSIVNDLSQNDGSVFAAGIFSEALSESGLVLNNIGAYSFQISDWHAMGSGLTLTNANTYSPTVYMLDTTVYVLGCFTQNDTVPPVTNSAVWSATGSPHWVAGGFPSNLICNPATSNIFYPLLAVPALTLD